jgi:hypothetical protein
MKSIIAASLAVLIGAGSIAAVTAPASAATVVVRVGHHWHHHGHWMWHGRYWGHRAWVCHRWHHHRHVCVWRYW